MPSSVQPVRRGGVTDHRSAGRGQSVLGEWPGRERGRLGAGPRRPRLGNRPGLIGDVDPQEIHSPGFRLKFCHFKQVSSVCSPRRLGMSFPCREGKYTSPYEKPPNNSNPRFHELEEGVQNELVGGKALCKLQTLGLSEMSMKVPVPKVWVQSISLL